MKGSFFLLAAAFVTGAITSRVAAGTYNQNFNSFGNGVTALLDGSYVASNNGPASVQGQRLRLTQNLLGNTLALYRLGDLDAGYEISGFDVQFDLALNGGAGNPADGLSFSFGGLPLSDSYGPGEEGYQLPGGLVVSFDTYINNPPETTRTLDVRVDGSQLVTVNESAFGNYQLTNATVHVTIHWDASGLDVIFGSYTVCNDLAVPALSPVTGDRFAWSARTGGASEDVFLDNIAITTTPTTPITRPNLALSEMVVDNTDYEDEFCQKPGWVEIYNGTASAVSLNGWSLTDDAAVPAKWPFPAAQSIAAYGHLVVFLGHGIPAPTTPDTRLHTSFTLSATPPAPGGFLGLYQGTTQIDSFTNYPQQFPDVSYGHLGHPWTLGFLESPSPGGKNKGLQESGGPVTEEVVWPRDGGLITGPLSLALTAPATAGAVIRYTLDNTAPTPASTEYTAPFSVTTSSRIRARIFAPNRLPGPVSSRTFLKLHSSVTNYRGTGQPFSSNLPVIVIDSFGRNLDAENSVTPGARPFRYTYAVILDRDPANGNRTRLVETAPENSLPPGVPPPPGTAPVNYQGRTGMHVRGESSSTMPQRQYSMEAWDNEDHDKDVSLLGMPADSDWILYAPATDKTLLRNYITYNSMFMLDGQGSAVRTRLVEVFFNQPTNDANAEIAWSDYRGVYVLMERIKRGKDRVDIAELDPCDTTPSLITGGYIFKKDKVSADPDFTTTNGQLLQIVEPLTTVGDAQWTYLRNYMNQFEAALYGVNYTDPVLGYRAYIDEQSFQDNEWWVEIFKQIDGYRLSTYFTKDRGGKVKSAPLWDYNLSMGNADYLAGWNYQGWYRDAGISQGQVGDNNFQYYWKLRQDPGYIQRLWDRYWTIRKGVLATPALMSRIDQAISDVTDNQPAANITNGTGVWPASLPSVEVPAARHHSRWQRLGIYDWPNAPGTGGRTKYKSSTDATDLASYTATPYNVTTPPPMSESVHLKAYMTNRLSWIDDAFFAGTSNVILRPPVFSQEGGNVTAPYNLTISAYTGTAPLAANYGKTGTLTYASGTIFYTLDGTDPMGGAASVVRNWVTEGNACYASLPTSAAFDADSTGKDWRDKDFNPLSPPAGVTWYPGTQGVGYDDSATPIDMNLNVGLRWSSPTFPQSGIPTMRNVAADSYIRLQFTLTAADIAGINKLHLYAKYDDGFFAWVNGVPIASKFAPAAPAWSSLATANRDDAAAVVWEDVTTINGGAAIAALREGTNVLAIQGMQFGGTNNADFLQRFRLDGEITNQTPYTGPITINSPVIVKARVLDNTTGLWSPLTEATFVVDAVPPTAANLVVSEIMYNPTLPVADEITAGYDNDNMFEYIEIMNIGPNPVDMSGVNFATGFEFSWPAANPLLRILGSGERAIISANAGAFAMRYAPGPGVKVVGVFNGNLGNGGEHLVLSGPGGVIKDFRYEDDPPWPVEADGLGYSLVLNHPASNPDHNLAVNWRSSFEVNGTPGGAPGASGPTGSAAAALADTDGDGITDLVEYATGTLGSAANSMHLPATGIVMAVVPPSDVEQEYLTFSYVRSRSADGFTFNPEVSTALTGWQPLSSMFTLAEQSNNPDGTATLTWRSTLPVSALPPRLFLQVRAGINP